MCVCGGGQANGVKSHPKRTEMKKEKKKKKESERVRKFLLVQKLPSKPLGCSNGILRRCSQQILLG